MTVCYRAFDGKVAFWEKPASSDPAVIMHPFFYPEEHMDIVYFHSDLRYLTNVLETDVTVNHTALAGLTGTASVGASGFGTPAQAISDGDVRETSIVAVTHNFGYAPLTFVITEDGEILSGATIIQTEGTDGRARIGSSWADSVDAGIHEVAFSSASTLSAISRDYKVLCFRQFDGDPAFPMLQLKPSTEIICFGHGKITQDDRPVRVPNIPGDAEWYVPITLAVDTRNGAIRTISPISGTTDVGLYTGSLFELRSVLMTNS